MQKNEYNSLTGVQNETYSTVNGQGTEITRKDRKLRTLNNIITESVSVW